MWVLVVDRAEVAKARAGVETEIKAIPHTGGLSSDMVRIRGLGRSAGASLFRLAGMRSSLFVRRLLRVSQKSPLSRRWPVLSAVLRLRVDVAVSGWAGGGGSE